MLHLAGGVTFGMNIGDFLELEGSFKGDRIKIAAPHIEKITGPGKLARQFFDIAIELEGFLDFTRQFQQISQPRLTVSGA